MDQVADFGLAKLSSDTNTHVSTRVMGTFGYVTIIIISYLIIKILLPYMVYLHIKKCNNDICEWRYLAPEYASSGKLTEKSDVFSFGVVLLELITGRRPSEANVDDDGLIDWVIISVRYIYFLNSIYLY